MVPKLLVTELKGLVLQPLESEIPDYLFRQLVSRLHDLGHTASVSPTTQAASAEILGLGDPDAEAERRNDCERRWARTRIRQKPKPHKNGYHREVQALNSPLLLDGQRVDSGVR